MVLTTLEILNGILSIVVILISLMIGLTIILKYFKYKQKTLIYVGLTWIGIFAPWYSSSISFLSVMLTGNAISAQLYVLIGGITATLVVYVWMTAFCFLTNRKKLIAYILTIETAILEIIFLYFVFTNPLLIGELTGPVDVTYEAFGVLYFINLMLIFIISTSIFGLSSFKSEKPDIKLKGIFILIGAYLFIIGAFLDTALILNLLTLTLARILLMVSGLIFYIGFVLPDFVRKLFLKSE